MHLHALLRLRLCARRPTVEGCRVIGGECHTASLSEEWVGVCDITPGGCRWLSFGAPALLTDSRNCRRRPSIHTPSFLPTPILLFPGPFSPTGTRQPLSFNIPAQGWTFDLSLTTRLNSNILPSSSLSLTRQSAAHVNPSSRPGRRGQQNRTASGIWWWCGPFPS